ncbi:MAG: sugar phosphate isomerase/epimerase family protein [Rhodothermales bacterium]|nr:sugar phosphate isomerase/epimerase family protein [Rhodothermales bacterium]
MDRRKFIASGTAAAGALALVGPACLSKKQDEVEARMLSTDAPDVLFGISLAQWSLHRMLQSGELSNLEFAAKARQEFDIGAIEFVSRFFDGRERETEYLSELQQRAADADVKMLLIMVDGQGNLGSPDTDVRRTAVENHFKWVQAAKYLGCHSIRVNAMYNDEAVEAEEQLKLSADGLRQLAEFADGLEINVLVENHGALSSNGQWLAGVMTAVDHPRCGTLPDFGNFCLDGSPYPPENCRDMYDPYTGTTELMPFAKAVSAKSYEFSENGDESVLDYERLMRIVLDAGYRGYVGIEYEGSTLPEDQGIIATRDLLLRLRQSLTPEYNRA